MDIKINQTTMEEILKELSNGAEDKIRVGYLTGKINDGKIAVDGVYVPQQKSSKSSTAVDAAQMAMAINAVNSLGKSILGLAHYTAKFSAFESAIARENRKQFVKLGFPDVALVLNANKEYRIFS